MASVTVGTGHVLHQVVGLGVRLGTQFAFVGFFAGVGVHVAHQLISVGELERAERTREGTNTFMHVLYVLLQRVMPGEPGSAKVTHVVLLLGVRQHVAFNLHLRVESHRANVAREGFITQVTLHVGGQRAFRGHTLATDGAFLGRSVGSPMFDQVLFRFKRFAASFAIVDRLGSV